MSSSPRSVPPALLAPGAPSGAAHAYAPGHYAKPPAVDERLAEPETHTEVVDGRVIRTMGANEPHAVKHFEIARVFADCLADGYEGAVDMLTRSTADTDAAPDVSVFPRGRDPRTGRRHLEEIAFEVVSTETVEHVTGKVRKLVARGVRRAFYVRVADRAVFEWSRDADGWQALSTDAEIRDACFRVPIPVQALVDRVLAEDTVARSLLASRNRVLEEALTGRQQEGLAEGLAPLMRLFERRLGRPLAPAEHAAVRARLRADGAERVGDAALDLTADELVAWLVAPAAP